VSDRPTSVRWRIVGLLVIHAMLMHFNRMSISVVGNERLVPDYHISKTLMATVYSAYLISYTLMMTPGGWVIDRFGARAALMLVAFGSTLFVGFSGAAGYLFKTGASLVAALIVIRTLMGITNAPFHPGAAYAVFSWVPAPQRSLANGLVGCAALVGIALTYPVFGVLMDRLGWPAAFMTMSGITLVAAAAWSLYAARSPEHHRGVNEAERNLILASSSGVAAAARKSAVPPWRKRSVILITISYAAVSYFQYMFFYWMEDYFVNKLKLGHGKARFYSMIATVAMAVGMASGGWLIDRAQARWGARRGRSAVAMAGMGLSAALLGVGIFCSEPAWIVVFFSLALGSLGTSEGTFWTTATDLGGDRGGVAAAIMNTGGNAGGVLATYLTALVGERYGWPYALALACIFCFLGAVNWAWIDPAEGFLPSSPKVSETGS
jgi:ACS family D-galactonate transporter-like MFS transporter